VRWLTGWTNVVWLPGVSRQRLANAVPRPQSRRDSMTKFRVAALGAAAASLSLATAGPAVAGAPASAPVYAADD
jgi:hypothetical protein